MVKCQMVDRQVPEVVCQIEQDKEACRGCMASTRRCTKCGKQKQLHDVHEGLCSDCIPKERKRVLSRPLQVDIVPGKIGLAMDDMVDLLRDLRDLEGRPVVHSFSEAQPKRRVTPELLSQARTVLCEHATSNGGLHYVQAPLKVIAMRLKLLPDEAHTVLTALRKQRLLVSERPGVVRLTPYVAPATEVTEDASDVVAAPKKRGRPPKNRGAALTS